MLNKLKTSNNKGFTIIEVMIVLAIAGLIILIVLLAVPALQRNGRNTAIKNDVSAVTAAINEYKSNNEGEVPTNVQSSGSTVTVTGTGTAAEGKIQSGTDVSIATAPGTSAGVVQVLLQKKCTNSTSFTPQATTNKRSVMIIYNIETSSGVAPRCIDA